MPKQSWFRKVIVTSSNDSINIHFNSDVHFNSGVHTQVDSLWYLQPPHWKSLESLTSIAQSWKQYCHPTNHSNYVHMYDDVNKCRTCTRPSCIPKVLGKVPISGKKIVMTRLPGWKTGMKPTIIVNRQNRFSIKIAMLVNLILEWKRSNYVQQFIAIYI